jgi:hypothetical protein
MSVPDKHRPSSTFLFFDETFRAFTHEPALFPLPHDWR